MRLEALLRGEPSAVAVVRSSGESWTYGRLAEQVQTDAKQLALEGVRPGQPVAVHAADPLCFLQSALAAWSLGGAVVPLDPRAGPRWLEGMAARAHARVRVSGRDPAGQLVCERREEARGLETEVQLLLFTSGSSGVPKGVLLTGEGILANVDAILEYLPIASFPRTGVVLPLAYSYALVGQVLTSLRAAATVILLGDIAFPAQQLRAIIDHRVLGLSSVPTSLRVLARAAKEGSAFAKPTLGYVASAGAPLDAETVRQVKEGFPGARLFNQYGLTEASPRVCALSDAHPQFADGAAGFPLKGVRAHCISEDGKPLPPGEEGELVVQGPSVMRGYLDDPVGTAAVLLSPGVLKTGDLAWMDKEGCIFVRGRKDGVIKSGGERISVEEVAASLREGCPEREVAVVALPDGQLGHKLVAFLEGPSSALEPLRRFVRDLPPAKRPVRILAMDALPRTSNGKLDGVALKTLAGAK